MSLVRTCDPTLPTGASDSLRSTSKRSCYQEATRLVPLHDSLLLQFDQNAYLECPGFFSKPLKTRRVRRNVFKVSFHLLAKAHVETANIRETRNSEIKVEHMEPITRKHFAEKSSLYAQQ
jgi:hypothetical protein